MFFKDAWRNHVMHVKGHLRSHPSEVNLRCDESVHMQTRRNWSFRMMESERQARNDRVPGSLKRFSDRRSGASWRFPMASLATHRTTLEGSSARSPQTWAEAKKEELEFCGNGFKTWNPSKPVHLGYGSDLNPSTDLFTKGINTSGHRL